VFVELVWLFNHRDMPAGLQEDEFGSPKTALKLNANFGRCDLIVFTPDNQCRSVDLVKFSLDVSVSSSARDPQDESSVIAIVHRGKPFLNQFIGDQGLVVEDAADDAANKFASCFWFRTFGQAPFLQASRSC